MKPTELRNKRYLLSSALFGLIASLAWADDGTPGCRGKTPGAVLAIEKTFERTREDLEDFARILGQTAKYGAHGYRVVYCTTDPRGDVVPASGAVIIPVETVQGKTLPLPGKLPIVSYQHGTQAKKSEVPSNPETMESIGVSAGLVTLGFAATATDYLGLGVSEGVHPYLHAKTEASSAADLLSALQFIESVVRAQFDKKIYLLGYSQGGHATMALHRYLEMVDSRGFEIMASAPMGGPYDLAKATVEGAITNPSPNTPFYATYVVMGMRSAYGIFTDVKEALLEPYASVITKMFEAGTEENHQYIKILPKKLEDMVVPNLMQALKTADSGNPLIKALAENVVCDWAPKAPTKLYHAGRDIDVPYKNAEVAFQRMRDLGAKNLELVNLGDVDHHGGALPAFRASIAWFAQTRSLTLENGRALYSAKCQRCHGSPDTTRIRNSTVAKINGAIASVAKMRGLATLSQDEIAAIALVLKD